MLYESDRYYDADKKRWILEIEVHPFGGEAYIEALEFDDAKALKGYLQFLRMLQQSYCRQTHYR